MTREDLARDILLAYIRTGNPKNIVEIPFADLAANAVDQADALLEALGAKEAPDPWLSKEMQTPAKGFPAIKGCMPQPGDMVTIRAKGARGLTQYDGYRGKVLGLSGSVWCVNIGVATVDVPACNLERVE